MVRLGAHRVTRTRCSPFVIEPLCMDDSLVADIGAASDTQTHLW